MKKTRKTINFDLRTNELKKIFDNTGKPYSQIKNFMLDNGFEHRQYSGYISKDVMDKDEINILLIKLDDKFPWFLKCVNKLDVANIDETNQYDLVDKLKNIRNKTFKENLSIDPVESIKAKADEVIKQMKSNKKDTGKDDLER